MRVSRISAGGSASCCWLVVLPAVADADIAVLAGRVAHHAVGRASLVAHFSPQSWQGGGPALPGDARLAWAGLLVAESLHRLLVAGRDPVVRRPSAPCRGARQLTGRPHRRRRPGSSALRGRVRLRGRGRCGFAVGFGFEVVGDYQLERFRGEPSNRGKVLDRGLWRYTRHPNYFGDATLWWGLYAIAATTPSGWLTVLSPALMTFLLMRVSGVTLLEDGLTASKPGYRAYITRTPAFFPWFPRVLR